jgi:hypothetical protein
MHNFFVVNSQENPSDDEVSVVPTLKKSLNPPKSLNRVVDDSNTYTWKHVVCLDDKRMSSVYMRDIERES